MARQSWALLGGRPAIEASIVKPDGSEEALALLADTGAGASHCPFELILERSICLACGGQYVQSVNLSGAYLGSFSVYIVHARIKSLNFDRYLRAVAVNTAPRGFDGIACYRFLNRFTFGNFGNATAFGLEV